MSDRKSSSSIFRIIQGLVRIAGPDGTIIGNEDNDRLKVKTANEDELLDKIEKLIATVLFSKSEKSLINDGTGAEFKAKVNEYNALKVYNQGIPDPKDETTLVPLTGFLSDDNQNFDARVDGSVSPIDFYIESNEDSDIYLTGLCFKIADQNAQLNQFGNIGALNTGFQLIYKNEDIGERVLIDNIRSNFDLIRSCQAVPAFSQGVESFRASNVVGGSEGYLPVLKINEVFNLPFGLRLQAGKKDRLILRIRDDVTGVDAFDIFYYANESIN